MASIAENLRNVWRIHELRQRILAPPYGRMRFVLSENNWDVMPHRRPGIGSIEDLDSATLEDARARLAALPHPLPAPRHAVAAIEAAVLEDLHIFSLEVAFARRDMLGLMAIGKNVLSFQIGVGMKHDRDFRSTIAFNKAHQAAGMIGMAVTQNYGMQLIALDFQDIHVVQYTVKRHASIEKKAISVAAIVGRHQH